jgi:4-amino-4-deoxy-L-arabinose transferase-like glycosyltransferase
MKKWISLAILVLMISQIALAIFLPLAEDEYYYWCWAQQLQLSYYDHPPGIAYMIRATCAIVGDNNLGIRLPSILSINISLAIIATIWRPSSQASSSSQAQFSNSMLIAIALCMFSPMVFLGGIISTPDTPLIIAWTCYVRWVVWLHQSEKLTWKHWIIGGLILGMGLLGKYTMAIAVPSAALSLIRKPWKDWFWGFIVHGLVGCLAFMPVLLYNYQLEFKPILYQLDHAFGREKTIRFLPDHLAAVITLQSPLVFPMLLLVFFRGKYWSKERIALTAMFCFPASFFLLKSFTGKLEANWSAVQFIAFVPLLAIRLEEIRESKLLTKLAYIFGLIPAILSLAILLLVLFEPAWIPAGWNRVQYYKKAEVIGRRFAEQLKNTKTNEPILIVGYRPTAMYRYLGVNVDQFYEQRQTHFLLHPRWNRTGDSFYAVIDYIDAKENLESVLKAPWYVNELKGYFIIEKIIDHADIEQAGVLKNRYYLCHYVRIPDPVTAKPTPDKPTP